MKTAFGIVAAAVALIGIRMVTACGDDDDQPQTKSFACAVAPADADSGA